MRLRVLLIGVAICTLPALAFAQQQPAPQLTPAIQKQIQQQMQHFESMTPDEMASYAATMQKNSLVIQNCYEQAGGEAKMKELEAKGQAMNAELKAMCDAGERDEAQAYAIAQSKAFAADPAIEQLKTCTGELAKDVPELAVMQNPETYAQNHHVCDQHQ